MNEKKYHCAKCGKVKSVMNPEDDPICCGRKMELLPVCNSPVTAENSHPDSKDQPCDDGLAGHRV